MGIKSLTWNCFEIVIQRRGVKDGRLLFWLGTAIGVIKRGDGRQEWVVKGAIGSGVELGEHASKPVRQIGGVVMNSLGSEMREAILLSINNNFLKLFKLLSDLSHVGGLDVVAQNSEKLIHAGVLLGVGIPHLTLAGGGRGASWVMRMMILPLHSVRGG